MLGCIIRAAAVPLNRVCSHVRCDGAYSYVKCAYSYVKCARLRKSKSDACSIYFFLFEPRIIDWDFFSTLPIAALKIVLRRSIPYAHVASYTPMMQWAHTKMRLRCCFFFFFFLSARSQVFIFIFNKSSNLFWCSNEYIVRVCLNIYLSSLAHSSDSTQAHTLILP